MKQLTICLKLTNIGSQLFKQEKSDECKRTEIPSISETSFVFTSFRRKEILFLFEKKRPMNGQLTSKESQYMWVEGRVRKNMLHNKGGRRG